MKFTVDDLMRNSFVISIGDDTYELFSRRMRNAGFSGIAHNYNGIIPPCFARNFDKHDICSLNHFNLVNMAKAMALDHVTIFEYDAYPMTNCAEVLDVMLGDGGIPDDADEIQFGNLSFIEDFSNNGTFTGDVLVDVDEKNRFGRIKKALWGAHAVTIFRRGYDSWLSNYRKQQDLINADYFNWLVQNCYSTARNYFIQVRDGKVDHLEMLRDIDKISLFPAIS